MFCKGKKNKSIHVLFCNRWPKYEKPNIDMCVCNKEYQFNCLFDEYICGQV